LQAAEAAPSVGRCVGHFKFGNTAPLSTMEEYEFGKVS